MREIGLAKFRFKGDKKDMWLDWTKELVKRKDEVMETLKNEGIIIEACFFSEKEQCIYYLIECGSFAKVEEVAMSSILPIDVKHRKIKLESIELLERMDVLFYFDTKE